MAGINLGLAFGNAMTSGIKTYGDLQNLNQQATLFAQQQQQVAREDEERKAASDGSAGTTTAVTPGTLASSMAGADGKADPDAVMGTYGAIQNPSQAPSQTGAIVRGGIAAGQMANDNAGQGPQSITVPQGPQSAAAPPAPGPVTPANAGGAPASFNAPSGNSVDQATKYVMAQEGGYVGNDNGKGPTNMGINGQANSLTPDQVAKLGPQDAAAIYKAKYFSGAGGGVDISKLPPTMAVAVGDTEANMGQATAGKLFQQSGGDINKFLDLRQKQYDSISADPATHQVWNNRMSSIRDFVNQHGTSETGVSDGSAPPVDPSTPLTPLHATPLPGNGLPDTMKFTHDGEGNVQMTKADSPADALQRMATKAFQTGDIKNGPTLMKAALDLRSQEAQANVTKIMTNTTLNPDQKVAQLASLTGMPAYKTDNGNYLIPGLGPTDAAGNPMPMSAVQAGALAGQLATPEGMQHIVETQQAMKAAAEKSKLDDSTIRKNDADVVETGAKAAQEGNVAKYYGVNADATAAEKNAKAAALTETANINKQLQALQDQASKLDPQAPNYTASMANIRAQHDMLIQRSGGKVADPQKVDEVKPGSTYRKPGNDQLFTALTGDGQPGIEVAAEQAPSIMRSWTNMQKDPDKYNGIVLVNNPTKPGFKTFAFKPGIAASLGLNPNQTYDDENAAFAARKAAVKGAGSSTPFTQKDQPGAGIPDTTNPMAY